MQDNNQSKQLFNDEYLCQKGLNIHAVLDLKNVPASVLEIVENSVVNSHKFNQLILIGHLGQSLWRSVNLDGMDSANPIDEFTVRSIQECFKKYYSANDYEIIYPGDTVIGLQQMGMQAGWHYASPFKVGINEKWGSWFAYRAVVLADTNFSLTNKLNSKSPCLNCKTQECVSACPSHALDKGELDFKCCIEYRKQENSLCKNTCFSRVSCPVGIEYQYTDEQVRYHYGVSMETIESFY